MSSSIRIALLLLVDVLLGFAILCVLPFAWIIRDRLGPETTGVDAIEKAFMTFYVGPSILVLILFDLLLRGSMPEQKSSQPKSTWLTALALMAALTFLLIWISRN